MIDCSNETGLAIAMLSVVSLAGGTLAIYCAERRPDVSARLETVGGLLIVVGLALIGFALPLYR